MKTKNNFHCLSSDCAVAFTLLLLLMHAGQAAAQPKSLEVEPGSKGVLPTPAPLEQGRFAGLWIPDVGMTVN